MRIIGGERRGQLLAGPGGQGMRPTGAYLREAVFNILAPGISGARVLDLFAGTGAIGLEALSRGAAQATFVDRDVRGIAANVARLGCRARAEILRADGLRAVGRLAARGRVFDVIYADPPYGAGLAEATVDAVAAAGLLAPGGVLLVERHHKAPVPETAAPLVRRRDLRHGETVVTIYDEGGA